MNNTQAQNPATQVETYDTIVIGGGQAGLASGYFLGRLGANFIILDQNEHSGDSWRARWDSLRLFTPSQFDSLPGLPFPMPTNYFPTKLEVADYLENYARHFHLPIRHNTKVEKLNRREAAYEILAANTTFLAQNVIVATGPFQRPYIPPFAPELSPQTFQLHSSVYQNPAQIPTGAVLVVGAGNSGAEIAIELSRAGRQVWLSGRDVGKVPANSRLGKVLDGRLVWWLMTHLLTLDTPIGRKMREAVEAHGTPLGRATRAEIAKAGVTLVPRMQAVQTGVPVLEDGRRLQVESVIWSTGFRADFTWIDLPIFDEHGKPRHTRGLVPEATGLYFIGQVFQSGLSSSLLGGVGKDAREIVDRICSKTLAS